MRKELIPSLVVALTTAAMMALSASGDFHRHPTVGIVKIVGAVGLVLMSLALVFSKKKPDADRV